jgi:hypothetical protein
VSAGDDAGPSALVNATRAVFATLALFDLALGGALLVAGPQILNAMHVRQFAAPRFFMICVALSLWLYVYVQYMAYRDPVAYGTCVTIALFIRLSFPIGYVAAIVAWGAPWTLMHALFAAAAAADLATSALLIFAMRRLHIGLWQGDRFLTAAAPSPWLSRILYAIAAIETIFGCNWGFLAHWWLRLFDVHWTMDPFWTRATGIFLVNMGLIQYLGARDLNRHRTAVITSGLFRALWPLFYWAWILWRCEGNTLFKVAIGVSSFYDVALCAAIFILLRRAVAAGSPAKSTPASAYA